MKRFRDPNWLLIILFLAILASVPAIQTLSELGQENGVKALDLFSETPTAANLRAFERDLEKSNWASQLSRHWLQFAQFAGFKEGGEKAVFGAPEWFFYKPGLNYMLGRTPPDNSAVSTNDPVRAIVHFRDQLALYGIHLLVVPVPNKDSIYPDRLTSRARGSHGIVAPRTRDILDRLHAAQVEVVDLFKQFSDVRAQGADKPELYLAQDTHWSPAGVAVAAKSVAQRLIQLGWAQPGKVDYIARPAQVQRLGDIVRMLQVPMIERSVKPETVPAVQILREPEGQPYKDELDSEVLVMGDSFMRIYQQDSPTAAGFIAHLARELKQPLLSLVNDGGGSTLVREELCARPVYLKKKKVVVWEFVERDLGLGIKGWQLTELPAIPKPPDSEKSLTLPSVSREHGVHSAALRPPSIVS